MKVCIYLRFLRPRTLSLLSTTIMGSDPSPIRQVPAMWWSVVVMDLTKKSRVLPKIIVRVLNLRKRLLKLHNYIKLNSRSSAGCRRVRKSASYGIPRVTEFCRLQNSAGKEFLGEQYFWTVRKISQNRILTNFRGIFLYF
jgi:hypothetical protein